MFLLDTNVISELRKQRPHGAVLSWLQGVDAADLRLSAMTVAEIQAGLEVTRDQDPEKAGEIEAWLDQVMSAYEVLPLNGAVMRVWARLMHRQSETLYEDALIAATAHVHRLTVVTRNTADFKPFDVPLLNPFIPAA